MILLQDLNLAEQGRAVRVQPSRHFTRSTQIDLETL
jgi:hypothetical protein